MLAPALIICFLNKNVDHMLSAHDAFLEYDALKDKTLESQINFKIYLCGVRFSYVYSTLEHRYVEIGKISSLVKSR